ncbi:putative trehalose-phosphate phosphatase 4 [Bienertia sinuspersici]
MKVAIAMAKSNSSLFSQVVLKPPTLIARRFVHRKPVKKLETQGGPPKINAWVVTHASAMDMFDEIARSSKGMKKVMFLNYDGTLSPIVQDPDRAFMFEDMRAAVARYFPTAIVSGRGKDKVHDFVSLKELYYACSHGIDIEGPFNGNDDKSVVCQPTSEFLPIINQVYNKLIEKLSSLKVLKLKVTSSVCLSIFAALMRRWPEHAEESLKGLQLAQKADNLAVLL